MTSLVGERQWEFLLRDSQRVIRLMATSAYGEPLLRRLFPYVSVTRLRFSVKQDYPFDPLPYIGVVDDEGQIYRVRDWDHRPVCEGTLQKCIVVLKEYIRRHLQMGRCSSIVNRVSLVAMSSGIVRSSQIQGLSITIYRDLFVLWGHFLRGATEQCLDVAKRITESALQRACFEIEGALPNYPIAGYVVPLLGRPGLQERSIEERISCWRDELSVRRRSLGLEGLRFCLDEEIVFGAAQEINERTPGPLEGLRFRARCFYKAQRLNDQRLELRDTEMPVRTQLLAMQNEELNQLCRELAEEFRNPKETGEPVVIVERPTTSSIHLFVIWSRFDIVDAVARSTVVLSAFTEAEGDEAAQLVTVAVGLTPDEATAMGIV